MKYNKITTGFVIQEYDSETGKCVSQEFVATDEVDYETKDGEQILGIESLVEKEEYFLFEMIQPEGDSE